MQEAEKCQITTYVRGIHIHCACSCTCSTDFDNNHVSNAHRNNVHVHTPCTYMVYNCLLTMINRPHLHVLLTMQLTNSHAPTNQFKAFVERLWGYGRGVAKGNYL